MTGRDQPCTSEDCPLIPPHAAAFCRALDEIGDDLPEPGREQTLSPEALLTCEAVRRLEQHTDIGPGNVGPLLMQVNLRQYEHALSVLREAGYTTSAPARNRAS